MKPPPKKRNLLRSSSLTAGPLSIEEYIYRCDPYRSISQEAPLPYPLTCHAADPPVTARVQAHKPGILQILADDGFPPVSQLDFVVDEVSKPEYPDQTHPFICLRLVYYRTPNAPEDLDATREKIMNVLILYGIANVEVEIVFMDLCFRPSSFVVRPDDPATIAYNGVRYQVLGVVKSRLGDKWCMLSMFNVGLTKAESVPSILITVDPFAVADWQDLAAEIRRWLPADDPAARGIQVEFILGRIQRWGV